LLSTLGTRRAHCSDCGDDEPAEHNELAEPAEHDELAEPTEHAEDAEPDEHVEQQAEPAVKPAELAELAEHAGHAPSTLQQWR
jgi:hypothetical protein